MNLFCVDSSHSLHHNISLIFNINGIPLILLCLLFLYPILGLSLHSSRFQPSRIAQLHEVVDTLQEKPTHSHHEYTMDEEGTRITSPVDYSGAREKTDPAEIRRVRNLYIWVMPTFLCM